MYVFVDFQLNRWWKESELLEQMQHFLKLSAVSARLIIGSAAVHCWRRMSSTVGCHLVDTHNNQENINQADPSIHCILVVSSSIEENYDDEYNFGCCDFQRYSRWFIYHLLKSRE